MSAILEIHDLEVTFRVGTMLRRQNIQAVAGVSFDVKPGETFALVGESGSGKTTLARAANGLQPISNGAVHFDGRRIDRLSAAAMKPLRRDMAMMFQDPVGSLSPRMKVGDLVTEPFRIHGAADIDLAAETQRLLSLVGLSADFADRFPHQLSGGQARRVGVARAIALNPKLIIADEPTAGLDVSVQGEVLNLLNELRERLGLSIVIITHNLHVVRHVADRVAVMYLGRFVETGSTETVFPHRRTPTPLPCCRQIRTRPGKGTRPDFASIRSAVTAGAPHRMRVPYALSVGRRELRRHRATTGDQRRRNGLLSSSSCRRGQAIDQGDSP